MFGKKTKSAGGRSPAYYAWQRLKKNRTAFASLIFISFCAVIAILGYVILPDATPQANKQLIELETLPPGTTVNILRVKKNLPPQKVNFFEKLLFGAPEEFHEYPFSTYKLLPFGYISILPPYIEGEENASDSSDILTFSLADVAFALSSTTPDMKMTHEAISFNNYSGEKQVFHISTLQKMVTEKPHMLQRTYHLGTDRFGRDMLSRLLLGTRISLGVGLIAVVISLFVGILFGALAGFFRGWVDNVVLWLINVVWSIPTFLLVMALALVLGRGFWQVFIAVGLTMWVDVARIVRGQILSARELEYVQAGRALGFRSGRLIFKHILPNILGPVMVIAAANFASAIVLEAGLSFLGVGVQPPAPSWGMMINDHYGYIVVDAAYLAILPGVAIALLVLSFNLLGNGLRDALDVRMKV